MKLSNWQKNISATEYYARVRPKKIPEMLQKAMKLTDEEVAAFTEAVQPVYDLWREKVGDDVIDAWLATVPQH